MAADFSFFVCFPFVGAGRGIAVGFVDCAFGMLAISKNTRSANFERLSKGRESSNAGVVGRTTLQRVVQ